MPLAEACMPHSVRCAIYTRKSTEEGLSRVPVRGNLAAPRLRSFELDADHRCSNPGRERILCAKLRVALNSYPFPVSHTKFALCMDLNSDDERLTRTSE